MSSDESELLITPKQAAKKLGVTDLQVRNLIRAGQLASVTVGKRKLIPKDAPARFVAENTVKTCPDETPDHAYDLLRDETLGTSVGPQAVVASSAARALLAATKLKSLSQRLSKFDTEKAARKNPLKS